MEARVASNEEGNLYVDITELRMDQVIVLISIPVWIKMLTVFIHIFPTHKIHIFYA